MNHKGHPRTSPAGIPHKRKSLLAAFSALTLGCGALTLTTTSAHADLLDPHCAENGDSTVTCTYTSTSQETFTVPAGVTTLAVSLAGGSGAPGFREAVGQGAKISADLSVAGGNRLLIDAGSAGTNAGGTNGAGENGGSGGSSGRGGGAASDIQASDGTKLIVAGGGGGGGFPINQGACNLGPKTGLGGSGGSATLDSGADGKPGDDITGTGIVLRGGGGGAGGSSAAPGQGGSLGAGSGRATCDGQIVDGRPGGAGKAGSGTGAGGGSGFLAGGGGGGGYTGGGQGGGGGIDTSGGGIGASGGRAGGGGGGAGSSYAGGSGVTNAKFVEGNTGNGSVSLTYDQPASTPLSVSWSSSLPSAAVGTAYDQSPLDGPTMGGTLPYTYSASGLPDGLSIDSGTGRITGTPTTTGDSKATVTVTDSGSQAQTASQSFTLTVNKADSAIKISNIDPAHPTTSDKAIVTASVSGVSGVDISGEATLILDGQNTPLATAQVGRDGTVTFSDVTLPAGEHTLTAHYQGSDQYKESTSTPGKVSVAFPQLTATWADSLPAATATQPYGPVTVAKVSGGDGTYTYTVTSGTLPTGITLDKATGQLTGTPTTAGTSTVTITVSDSQTPAMSASHVFTLIVNSNDPCTAQPTIKGTPGNNVINGTPGNDVINGGGGTDVINGGGGNDMICTGSGTDTITTGGGNDVINAGDGTNIIKAGDGTNIITSGKGTDIVTTGSGNDQINAGDGTNTVTAGDGNNNVTTGSGTDKITTGSGNDTITSGAGTDVINAGSGKNTIDGGPGTDVCTPTTSTLKNCNP
ncbi:putative Ig domain-containing protein [Streptomyces sp. NPDC055085]